MTEKNLEGAYALKTPEDSKRLYADWAETYDEDFAARLGYVYPEQLAAMLAARGAEGPLLDIGCGTGLVGAATAIRPLDGVDISAEMLEAARGKDVYRDLIEADLTASLPMPGDAYRSLISTGTFTHGHVGPEALPELVRIAAPGAIFALGINQAVFEAKGFPAALARLVAEGAITEPEYEIGAVYADDADHDHKDDKFTAAIFLRR
ncbi:MAG: methyltransferase domain-containing protein [Pseudomonadota bacterium]